MDDPSNGGNTQLPTDSFDLVTKTPLHHVDSQIRTILIYSTAIIIGIMLFFLVILMCRSRALERNRRRAVPPLVYDAASAQLSAHLGDDDRGHAAPPQRHPASQPAVPNRTHMMRQPSPGVQVFRSSPETARPAPAPVPLADRNLRIPSLATAAATPSLPAQPAFMLPDLPAQRGGRYTDASLALSSSSELASTLGASVLGEIRVPPAHATRISAPASPNDRNAAVSVRYDDPHRAVVTSRPPPPLYSDDDPPPPPDS